MVVSIRVAGAQRAPHCPNVRQALLDARRCFLCLRLGHVSAKCPDQNSRQCKRCRRVGHHHTLICPDITLPGPGRQATTTALAMSDPPSSMADPGPARDRCESISSATVQSCSPSVSMAGSSVLFASEQNVLLQTAIVQLVAADGKTVNARLLLNSGSHQSYITSHLAAQLGMPTLRTTTLSVSTFGSTNPHVMDLHVIGCDLPTINGQSLHVEPHVVPHITHAIPRSPLSGPDQKELTTVLRATPSIPMADPMPLQPDTVEIDLLLGSDYFWDVVQGRHTTLPSGLHLLLSKFGFILGGRRALHAQSAENNRHTQVLVVSSCVRQVRTLPTKFHSS